MKSRFQNFEMLSYLRYEWADRLLSEANISAWLARICFATQLTRLNGYVQLLCSAYTCSVKVNVHKPNAESFVQSSGVLCAIEYCYK